MTSALANFLAVGIRPRETMRRILDAGRDRMMFLILFLVTVSFMFGDADRTQLSGLPSMSSAYVVLIVCGVIVGVVLFSLLLFYLFSWAAYAIGRVLEGQGTPREIRSAMAWGGVPYVWALLYRVPAVIWFPVTQTQVRTGSKQVVLSPQLGEHGCLALVIFGALEVLTLIWYLYVISNTVGEAHRFSSWRGLATIVLTAITPIVITIAAVLAM